MGQVGGESVTFGLTRLWQTEGRPPWTKGDPRLVRGQESPPARARRSSSCKRSRDGFGPACQRKHRTLIRRRLTTTEPAFWGRLASVDASEEHHSLQRDL